MYDHGDLEENLTYILCLFSKTTAVLSQVSVTSQGIASFYVYHSRPEFSPVEQESNTIREWLVTSITDLPLSHQWTHLSWQVGVVAHRVHSSLRL